MSAGQVLEALRSAKTLTAAGLLAFAVVGCGGGGGGGDDSPPTSQPGGETPSTGGGDVEWTVPLADHFIAGMVDGVNLSGLYHVKGEGDEEDDTSRLTSWTWSYNLETNPGSVDRRYLATIGQGLAANSSLTVQWKLVFNQRVESDRIGPNNPYRCGGGIAIELIAADLNNPQSPFYSSDSQLGGNCEIIFTSVNENSITGTFTGVLAPRDSSQKAKTVTQAAFSLRNSSGFVSDQEGTVAIASNFSSNDGVFTAGGGMPMIGAGFINRPSVSPEIQFVQAPNSTVTFAVIMESADAGNSTGQSVVGCSVEPCVHWSAFNIPRTKTIIGEGESLEGISGVVVGQRYTGPVQRYIRGTLPYRTVAWDSKPVETVTYMSDYSITVYALNATLPISASNSTMNRAEFEKTYRSNIVGRTVWNGVYEFDKEVALILNTEYRCADGPMVPQDVNDPDSPLVEQIGACKRN